LHCKRWIVVSVEIVTGIVPEDLDAWTSISSGECAATVRGIDLLAFSRTASEARLKGRCR
jgi:hypothetical protein